MEQKNNQTETLEVLKAEEKKTPTERVNELGFHISPKFHAELMRAKKKVIRGNLDRTYVIDGREGEAGKSTLGRQLCHAVDPKRFCLKNIVFTAEDFEKRIKEAEKYEAILFDESFRGLSNKAALSKQNKRLIGLFQECRQRNLFIFVVLPSIFMLERYIAIFRSHALIHCFCSKKNIMRRYYKIYNYKNKKELYLRGKTMMTYTRPKIRNIHKFYAKFPPSIDEKAYNDKKLAAFQDYGDEKTEESKHLLQRNMAWWILTQKKVITQADLIEFYRKFDLGVSKSTMSHAIDTVPKKFDVRSSFI